jgi:antirestriction protein ArdC
MSKTKKYLQDFAGNLASAMVKNGSKWDCIFKRGSMPINASTNKRYKGINWLMLNYETEQKEYSKSVFASYKQWASLKAQVKKGSKGTPIVFYKPIIRMSKVDPTKEVNAGCILNYSTIFNIDQVDLSESTYKPDEFKSGKQYSIDQIDTFVKATKVEIQHSNGNGCYYSPSKDFINMELKTNFKDTLESDATIHYYSTLFHELTHSTGHGNRLDRKNKFDDHKKSYAYEELIAEIGSIFFGYEFNITKTIRDNHAKYLNSWISNLNNDYTFLTGATAQAQKALDYFVSSK